MMVAVIKPLWFFGTQQSDNRCSDIGQHIAQQIDYRSSHKTSVVVFRSKNMMFAVIKQVCLYATKKLMTVAVMKPVSWHGIQKKL